MLTLSSSIPSSLITAIHCDANASLISKMSTESMSQLALERASLVASTGPIPIKAGSHTVRATDSMRASCWRLLDFAKSSLHTSNETAPSVSGDEVAAVTVPSSLKAGFSLDIDSLFASGLIQPSD